MTERVPHVPQLVAGDLIRLLSIAGAAGTMTWLAIYALQQAAATAPGWECSLWVFLGGAVSAAAAAFLTLVVITAPLVYLQIRRA